MTGAEPGDAGNAWSKGEDVRMPCKPSLLLLVVATGVGSPALPAHDRHPHRVEQEYRDGPCTVKRERSGRERRLEVKCRDGIGADWSGAYKRAFREGRCTVRIEATRDRYTEERSCDE